MNAKPLSLYFARSTTRTILHLPDLSRLTARLFSIRKERRTIRIYMTLCDEDTATHIPLASYASMEDALADMEDLMQAMSKEDEYAKIG